MARSARGVWRVAWSRWWRCGFESMIDGGDVGRSRWWFNLSLWCGLVLVCAGLLGLGWFGLWVDLGMCGGVEARRRWRFDWRWFFFVWVDRCWLIWCWFFFDFWMEIGWVLMEFWLACLEIDFWFNGFWFLMMVVMVAVGLWERGAVREWIIKNCKIMNILLNKCGE